MLKFSFIHEENAESPCDFIKNMIGTFLLQFVASRSKIKE